MALLDDLQAPLADLADYLMGHAVAIEVQSGTVGQRGGPTGEYVAVVGSEAVPCLVLEQSLTDEQVALLPRESHRMTARKVHVLFDTPVTLGDRHRLVYADPITGNPRYFYVAAVKDAGGAHALWIAETMEYPA